MTTALETLKVSLSNFTLDRSQQKYRKHHSWHARSIIRNINKDKIDGKSTKNQLWKIPEER